jgi:hypothetical protein
METHFDVAMIEASQVTAGDFLFLFHDEDNNPPNFVHPEDLKEGKEPIIPEYIRQKKPGHHRLLFRVSFKLGTGKFVPLTFICDTGAPSHFYLSRQALAALEAGGRVLVDGELDYMYVVIAGKKAIVKETPYTHEPGNIMGLLMLERLGLNLKEGEFSFASQPEHF